MDRRAFIVGGAALMSSASLAGGTALTYSSVVFRPPEASNFLINRTDSQWRSMLTRREYRVMRRGEAERAGSSILTHETREGTYICKGCNLALYSSEDKISGGFDWPNFYQSLPDAVGTKPDNTWFTKKDEVHCRRCGSHLGHLYFHDEEPTGMRHQVNGISLKFITASEADYILHRSSSRVIRV